MKRRWLRIGHILIMAALIAACGRVDDPTVLTQTPGPAFTVADGVYRNLHWQAEYPEDWRVISTAASDRIGVIFVAPDDCTLILLSEAQSVPPQPPGCSDDTTTESLTIAAGEHTVYLTWVTETARAEAIQPIIERVVTSIAAV